jgi:hypothetical protein
MPSRRATKAGVIAASVALLAGGASAVGTQTAATAATPAGATVRYLGWATVFGSATVAEFRTSNGRKPRVTTSAPGFFFVTFPAANPVTNVNHAAVQVSVLNEFHVTCVVGTRHVDSLTNDFTVGVECRNLDTREEVNAAFSLLVLV